MAQKQISLPSKFYQAVAYLVYTVASIATFYAFQAQNPNANVVLMLILSPIIALFWILGVVIMAFIFYLIYKILFQN